MSFADRISKADVRFVLSIILILGSIILLALIFTVAIPEPNKDMAYLFVGAYVGWTGATVHFWIGTSKGSADKQQELNEIRKNVG